MPKRRKAEFKLDSDAFRAPLDEAKQELRKVALYIEQQAKVRCAVDTGLLRSSIVTRVVGDGVEVGTNVEYAPHVEFGTKYQEAQPFLRPAIQAAARKFGE